MKKTLFILMSLLFLLSTKGLSYDFYLENEDGSVVYLNDVTQFEFQPELEVVGGAMNSNGIITIPAKYGKYKVVGIGPNAFSNFSSLKEIVFPDEFKYIQQGAFQRCTSLNKIELPETLFEIAGNAFYLCLGLKEIRLTASLVSSNALDYCQNLEKIIFSSNVVDVASWAFTNCNKIKTLIFEDGAGEIFLGYGGNNFEQNYGLFYGLKLDSVYLGRGINYRAKSEKQLPFYGTGIERPQLGPKASTIPPFWYSGYEADEFDVPESVTHIANNAFQGSRINKIVLNKNLKKIGDYALNCTAEVVQHSESSIESIGKYAFKSSRVKEFRLPNGMIEIPEGLFGGCSSLRSISIPQSITRICDGAFSGCHNLNITDDDLPQSLDSLGIGAFSNTAIETLSIPDGISQIHDYLFSNCANLKSIILHDNIYSIGDGAFENCKSLESIQFPTNLVEIGNYAFESSGLRLINVPFGVRKIGEYAFAYCEHLQNVKLPDELEFLEICSFAGCTFSSFSFPKKIKYLRSRVLENCKSLETVQLPTEAWDNSNYNYVIISDMFTGCRALKELDIPACVQFINGGFSGCESLSKITIEDSNRIFLSNNDNTGAEIATPLFADCPLDSIYIGCNVLLQDNPKLDSYSNTAFYGQKIKNVELGGYMSEIPSFLFPNCEIGTTIISDKIKTIKTHAFIETVPDTVICIGSNPANMELDALKDALVSVPANSGPNYRLYDSWNQNLIVDSADTITIVKVRYPGAIIASFKQSGVMEPENVTKVKIEGKINDSDWLVLKNDLPHIYYMDLSGAIIDSIPSGQFKDDYKIMDILLPSTIKKIGDFAFSECNNLKLNELVLESCEYIGKSAFSNLCIEKIVLNKPTVLDDRAFANSKVSTIVFNDAVQIGVNTFADCKHLRKIVFNAKSSIGEEAFRNCPQLTNVTLPELNGNLGDGAFADCSNLIEVKFPKRGFIIGKSAFENCVNLKSLNIDGDGYKIAPYAFANTGINNVTLSNDIYEIGAYAFSNCTNLSGHITLPSSLTIVDEGMFKECSSIESISMGDSVTQIGAEAFSGCVNLVDINLPKSLIKIEPNVFYGCKNISELDIPFGLANFNGAFNNCNIKKLRTHWQVPILIDESTFDGFDEDKCVLTVPANSAMYYLTTDVWKIFWNIEEDANEEVERIQFKDSAVKALCVNNWDITNDGELGPDEALRVESLGNIFANNSEALSFDELICFSRLKKIDATTFAGCSNLQSIGIPASVVEIEPRSFETCHNLLQITIDNNNPIYDSRDNCNGIILSKTNTLLRGCNNTVIPNSVTNITEYAFAGNKKLIDVIIPNSVTIVGDYAFYGCENLKHIEMSDSMSFLANNTFVGCDSLKYLYIGKNMRSVSKGILKHCPNIDTLYFNNEEIMKFEIRYENGQSELYSVAEIFGNSFRHVILGDNVKRIPNHAFESCAGLETIDISESCDSIESYAFYDCSSLTKFDIPSRVKVIPHALFWGCGKLNSIKIPDGVKKIEADAFNKCASLDSIVIPNSVSTLGYNIFRGCSSLNYASLSNNIEELPQSTFEGCVSLKSLVIPHSVVKIANSALAETCLDSLYLSRGLQELGDYVFRKAQIGYLNMPCCNLGNNAFLSAQIKNLVVERNSITGQSTMDFNDNQIIALAFTINCNFTGLRVYGKVMTSLSIGSENYNDVKISIPKGTFFGCTALKNVYLGQNVVEIGDNSFASCGIIDSLYLPRGLEYIGDYAFEDTRIRYLNLPCCNTGERSFVSCTIDALSIERNPITGCDYIPFFSPIEDKLESLSIIDCKLPGNETFRYEDRLKSVYIGTKLGNEYSTITLPEKAFTDCPNLESVYLGANVNTIGDRAFSSCLSLKKVTLSNGLTKIGNNAFFNTTLDTIRIPSTVTEMYPIDYIDNVYVQWKEPIFVEGTRTYSSTLYVPGGTKEKYMTSDYWKTFTNIVEYFTLGDVNNDGLINITDAIGIVNHILKQTPSVFVEGAADVNQDGIINVTDAISVINKILKVETELSSRQVPVYDEIEPQ